MNGSAQPEHAGPSHDPASAQPHASISRSPLTSPAERGALSAFERAPSQSIGQHYEDGREGASPADESTPDGGPPRKRKKRVVQAFTCEQCTRRKQKCNKEIPCQNCTDRGVGDQCRLYIPGQSAIPKDPRRSHRRLSTPPESGGQTPSHEAGDGLSGDAAFKNEMRSRMDRLEALIVRQAERAGPSEPQADVKSSAEPQRHVHPQLPTGPHSLEANSALRRLIKTSGVSPSKLVELFLDLPEYAVAHPLLERFITVINVIKYPVHAPSFRQAVQRVYAKRDAGGELEPADVRNLPLIYIVLAISARNAPSEKEGDELDRRAMSLRLYWGSRRSILIAASVQPESVELVVTRLLTASFLIQHDRRLTEAWSELGACVRTAQAIGCHRDGTVLGLSPNETQYRRRLWFSLCHMDHHYALLMGRPPLINDAYHDVQEPLNVALDSLKPEQPMTVLPMTQPTSGTVFILRTQLSALTGKIAHHFQKLHEPARYQEVERLDREISRFIDSLPPHFRLENPDTSLDQQEFYLVLHRYSLSTELLLIRIILHRPWFLRNFWDQKYALSRKACFEAAKLDFLVRHAFYAKHQKYTAYFTGRFREFNSAMIAGIAAILDPHAPDAEQMRFITKTYLDRHPIDKQASASPASQKETAIIYILYRRGLDILDRTTPARHLHPCKDPVAFLLGIPEAAGVPPSASRPRLARTEENFDGDLSQPSFGASDATMVLVRDIYDKMLRTGMVDKSNMPSFQRSNSSDRLTRPTPVSNERTSHDHDIDQPAALLEPAQQQVLQDTFNGWLLANGTYPAENVAPVAATGYTDIYDDPDMMTLLASMSGDLKYDQIGDFNLPFGPVPANGSANPFA